MIEEHVKNEGGLKRGRCIITGAAGGFGRCFARRLAAMHYDLALIDCRGEALRSVRDELREQHRVDVRCYACDLTHQASLEKLAGELVRQPVEYLVNNAGFAHLRNFAEISSESHAKMAALHVQAPMRLIRAVLPAMIERKRGVVINVSSLGAWLPAGDAQYAATKAYLLVLSQALHTELAPHGIHVQALCPSFVDTGFHHTAEMQRFPKRSIPASMWMRADAVVACSLKAAQHNRGVVIPGWRNRLVSVALRSPFLQPLIGRLVGRSAPSMESDVLGQCQ